MLEVSFGWNLKGRTFSGLYIYIHRVTLITSHCFIAIMFFCVYIHTFSWWYLIFALDNTGNRYNNGKFQRSDCFAKRRQRARVVDSGGGCGTMLRNQVCVYTYLCTYMYITPKKKKNNNKDKDTKTTKKTHMIKKRRREVDHSGEREISIYMYIYISRILCEWKAKPKGKIERH